MMLKLRQAASCQCSVGYQLRYSFSSYLTEDVFFVVLSTVGNSVVPTFVLQADR
jgi:ribosome-associated toxin RatA of RatAB toxin-antitoxin module